MFCGSQWYSCTHCSLDWAGWWTPLLEGTWETFQDEKAYCTVVWACSSAVWVVRTPCKSISSHGPTSCLLYDVAAVIWAFPQGSLHGVLNLVKGMSNCEHSQPEWLPLCLSRCLASGLRCHVAVALCRPYPLSSIASQSFGLAEASDFSSMQDWSSASSR